MIKYFIVLQMCIGGGANFSGKRNGTIKNSNKLPWVFNEASILKASMLKADHSSHGRLFQMGKFILILRGFQGATTSVTTNADNRLRFILERL